MSTPQELRDVILLEADFLNTHALRLDQWSKSEVARSVLERQLALAASMMRTRAKTLHEVLAASEPKAEAS